MLQVSDKTQEQAMQKIQAAVKEIEFKRKLADHLSGQFLDPSNCKGKKFGEEEKEQWPET